MAEQQLRHSDLGDVITSKATGRLNKSVKGRVLFFLLGDSLHQETNKSPISLVTDCRGLEGREVLETERKTRFMRNLMFWKETAENRLTDLYEATKENRKFRYVSSYEGSERKRFAHLFAICFFSNHYSRSSSSPDMQQFQRVWNNGASLQSGKSKTTNSLGSSNSDSKEGSQLSDSFKNDLMANKASENTAELDNVPPIREDKQDPSNDLESTNVLSEKKGPLHTPIRRKHKEEKETEQEERQKGKEKEKDGEMAFMGETEAQQDYGTSRDAAKVNGEVRKERIDFVKSLVDRLEEKHALSGEELKKERNMMMERMKENDRTTTNPPIRAEDKLLHFLKDRRVRNQDGKITEQTVKPHGDEPQVKEENEGEETKDSGRKDPANDFEEIEAKGHKIEDQDRHSNMNKEECVPFPAVIRDTGTEKISDVLINISYQDSEHNIPLSQESNAGETAIEEIKQKVLDRDNDQGDMQTGHENNELKAIEPAQLGTVSGTQIMFQTFSRGAQTLAHKDPQEIVAACKTEEEPRPSDREKEVEIKRDEEGQKNLEANGKVKDGKREEKKRGKEGKKRKGALVSKYTKLVRNIEKNQISSTAEVLKSFTDGAIVFGKAKEKRNKDSSQKAKESESKREPEEKEKKTGIPIEIKEERKRKNSKDKDVVEEKKGAKKEPRKEKGKKKKKKKKAKVKWEKANPTEANQNKPVMEERPDKRKVIKGDTSEKENQDIHRRSKFSEKVDENVKNFLRKASMTPPLKSSLYSGIEMYRKRFWTGEPFIVVFYKEMHFAAKNEGGSGEEKNDHRVTLNKDKVGKENSEKTNVAGKLKLQLNSSDSSQKSSDKDKDRNKHKSNKGLKSTPVNTESEEDWSKDLEAEQKHPKAGKAQLSLNLGRKGDLVIADSDEEDWEKEFEVEEKMTARGKENEETSLQMVGKNDLIIEDSEEEQQYETQKREKRDLSKREKGESDEEDWAKEFDDQEINGHTKEENNVSTRFRMEETEGSEEDWANEFDEQESKKEIEQEKDWAKEFDDQEKEQQTVMQDKENGTVSERCEEDEDWEQDFSVQKKGEINAITDEDEDWANEFDGETEHAKENLSRAKDENELRLPEQKRATEMEKAKEAMNNDDEDEDEDWANAFDIQESAEKKEKETKETKAESSEEDWTNDFGLEQEDEDKKIGVDGECTNHNHRNLAEEHDSSKSAQANNRDRAITIGLREIKQETEELRGKFNVNQDKQPNEKYGGTKKSTNDGEGSRERERKKRRVRRERKKGKDDEKPKSKGRRRAKNRGLTSGSESDTSFSPSSPSSSSSTIATSGGASREGSGIPEVPPNGNYYVYRVQFLHSRSAMWLQKEQKEKKQKRASSALPHSTENPYGNNGLGLLMSTSSPALPPRLSKKESQAKTSAGLAKSNTPWSLFGGMKESSNANPTAAASSSPPAAATTTATSTSNVNTVYVPFHTPSYETVGWHTTEKLWVDRLTPAHCETDLGVSYRLLHEDLIMVFDRLFRIDANGLIYSFSPQKRRYDRHFCDYRNFYDPFFPDSFLEEQFCEEVGYIAEHM